METEEEKKQQQSSIAGLDTTDEDFDFFYDYAKAADNRSQAWTPQNWESEMEKHPLFISKNPEPGQQAPLVEALTQLKYDPEFNSPLELIESYKSDGNENFRLKKYRWALDSYLEGVRIARRELSKPEACLPIETKIKIIKMVATLYNNRASAHFYLENYRSSSRDARLAASLDPANQKAILRVANCFEKLRKWNEMIEYCEESLRSSNDGDGCALRLKPNDATRAELAKMLDNAKVESKKRQRDERRAQRAEDERLAAQSKIEQAVRSRGIVFRGSLFETDHGAAVHRHLVHFDLESLHTNEPQNCRLIWPVVFVYPEYGQTDFVQHFHELTTFRDMLSELFRQTPEWDAERKYQPDKLRVWYHSYEDERYSGLILRELKADVCLLEALTSPGFVITNAIPTFLVALEPIKA